MSMKERKMRVMVVTDQYEPMVGGVPTVTRELARRLADRGHDVALVAPSPGWRGRRTTAGQVNVTFRGSLRWPWYDDMRLGCLPAPAARKLVASFAPDVAHIHSPVTLGVMARIGASPAAGAGGVYQPLHAGQRPPVHGPARTDR